MADFRDTPRQGLELRWQVFGIRFRVLPMFFVVSAMFAYLFVGPNLLAIALDVACIFVAILFTEIVQALVYRSFGQFCTVCHPGVWRRSDARLGASVPNPTYHRGAFLPRIQLSALRVAVLLESGIPMGRSRRR